MINKDNCDKLKHDSKEPYKRLVNDTTERFKKQKLMREKVSVRLKTENPRTAKCYS